MNLAPLIFLASFFALATSWLSFVLVPQLQLGGIKIVRDADTGQAYPAMRPGLARQGEQIYRANGCFYCHSQQVRPKGFGSDVERGWGARAGKVQSVDQDYLYDKPAMLGTQRVGPDLANIGARQTNEMALLQHLYNPQSVMPKSVMPPYRFLFEQRKLKIGEKPSVEALPAVAGEPTNYQVLPTADAHALTAYLLSLHSDVILFETPPPKTEKKTNAPAAVLTNAPNASKSATNSPAK